MGRFEIALGKVKEPPVPKDVPQVDTDPGEGKVLDLTLKIERPSNAYYSVDQHSAREIWGYIQAEAQKHVSNWERKYEGWTLLQFGDTHVLEEMEMYGRVNHFTLYVRLECQRGKRTSPFYLRKSSEIGPNRFPARSYTGQGVYSGRGIQRSEFSQNLPNVFPREMITRGSSSI